MQAATKVVFNTVVLYAKIIVSMTIALVSVPLVLKALGVSDYGLYNLVAGVVAMLSFLNNSMTVSSQRYMSVAMGSNDENRINLVYNTSFFLHLIMGCIIVIILECGTPFIGRLNIDSTRIESAEIIYQFLVLSTFCKIISVPFDAIINAHEDLLVFSIIELLDSVLMLLLAVGLQYLPGDKLIIYGFGVALIAFLNYFLKYGWTLFSYKKYRIHLKKYYKDLVSKEMFGFAGWNLFGGLATIGRNQGVAVVINMFLGTIANAAYGVANQINGVLSHFTTTFQKAINPQLMKSEGMNNRERLIRISFVSSKYSVLALCFFAVPFIIEMDDILSIWLKDNIPPFTQELSCYILLLSIVHQFSAGIMSSIQAVGKIRDYQITMGLILLTNVPLSYVIIKAGYPIYYATAVFVVMEVISLIIRLYFAKNLVNMRPWDFIWLVFVPVLITIVPSVMLCIIPHLFISFLWMRLIVTFAVFILMYILFAWKFALDYSFKDLLKNKAKYVICSCCGRRNNK